MHLGNNSSAITQAFFFKQIFILQTSDVAARLPQLLNYQFCKRLARLTRLQLSTGQEKAPNGHPVGLRRTYF